MFLPSRLRLKGGNIYVDIRVRKIQGAVNRKIRVEI